MTACAAAYLAAAYRAAAYTLRLTRFSTYDHAVVREAEHPFSTHAQKRILYFD